MKKIICLLLLVLLTCGLASCKVTEKTFTKAGITVTLDSTYRVHQADDRTCSLISNKAVFVGNKESYSDLKEYDFSDKDNPAYYGDLVREANNLRIGTGSAKPFKNVLNNNGKYSAYTIYDNEAEGMSFRYLMVVMYGEKYAYCMNFGTEVSEFENYQWKFMEYAKTISVE